MRSFATAVLAILIAATAQAQEINHESADAGRASASFQDVLPGEVSAESPAPEAPSLAPLQVEEQRTAPDASDAAAQMQRGSFWWYVGVLVVAGVILAVVL